MTTLDTIISSRFHRPKPNHTPHFKCTRKFPSGRHLPGRRRPFLTLVSSSSSKSKLGDTNKEDFVTKVLKENPSQIEPRYLIERKLYTLREKEGLEKNMDMGFVGFLVKWLGLREKTRRVESEKSVGDDVYLKDLLREYRGKLYLPEQVFGLELSEEEEFDRSLEELPRMSLEDFRKAMKTNKVKLLTSKEASGQRSYLTGFRDFIVDLKEIPGEKSLQRTKWALKVDEVEAREILEEYVGPQYQVEGHMKSFIGRLPEYPHPVASSISSRIMVELGMVTAVMAAAAVVVGGFMASAIFAVTSFIYVTTVYVAWPIVRPFF